MGGLKHDVRNTKMTETLIERLRKRAEIRRKIPRGEPDRIADLLEEAAEQLVLYEQLIRTYEADM